MPTSSWSANPSQEGSIPSIDYESTAFAPTINGQTFSSYFSGSVVGQFVTRVTGTHNFRLCSIDGSKLYVAGDGSVSSGTLVINNDGRHAYAEGDRTIEPFPCE